ncbi:MAG: transposase [Pseudonocardia sp.]|nr:transposase [Pseudonocardia sp.]
MVLDHLWGRLGIDAAMARLPAGRVLFALVANRALDPSSKMAAAGWVNRRPHIDGLPEVSDDACYRAMDWLIEIAPELEKEVFWQVATLLDSQVDLFFFDTTSSYFEIEEPDQPVVHDDHGRRLPDHPACCANSLLEHPTPRGPTRP